ncbi:DUF1441 family protein [Halomonas sp.]|uniref:DUF1441 family protein n=1 Tax=Halomonas sp. TaxID=1486246 RepID=UPI003D0B3EB8
MAEINRLEEAYNWNITRLADAFGLDRGTVRRRLRDAGVVPAGNRNGVSVYALKDAGPALFGEVVSAGGIGPDEMLPADRKAWYQSENERIKLEKEMRLLVPVEEVHREMSRFGKAVASGLDGLADMLERDAGLPAEAIELVERVTDALREQMYQAIIEDDADEVADG